MRLSIVNIRKANPDEWDAIWKECDYSTYFHSREWAEVWQVYTNQRMRPDPKLILFSDGKKALLTFSSQRSLKGLVKRYISSPAGTFGGWLSNDDLRVAHASILAKHICKTFGNLEWRLNPYDRLAFEAGVRPIKNDETHALNLQNGFETVYKQWTKGHASAARKARKAGIIVRLAENAEDWKEYYAAYEASLKRWGEKASSRYEYLLFEEMFNRKSPNIKLWLAIYNSKIVSGALCFYAKKHVVYWHGAALAKYFNLRPVNLLMYEAIKEACEKDYCWFDFNPSGGHEGVKAFKKSFGAEAFKCPVVTTETTWAKLFIKLAGIIQKVKL